MKQTKLQSNIWKIGDHTHQHLKPLEQKLHTKLRQGNLLRKNPPKQKPAKAAPPLETKVVVVVPVDQLEEQVPLYPPNQPYQLPDNQPDEPPNTPPNQPNPPANPPNPPANPPNQPPNLPANPPNLMQPQNPPPQVPQVNWSSFQPEFSGKPEEDAVVHLLRTNDWMETHNFPDNAKVQRFCLTLMGEARFWYEMLRPINPDWTALQECFRQQYANFGSTREQYSMYGDHCIMMKM